MFLNNGPPSAKATQQLPSTCLQKIENFAKEHSLAERLLVNLSETTLCCSELPPSLEEVFGSFGKFPVGASTSNSCDAHPPRVSLLELTNLRNEACYQAPPSIDCHADAKSTVGLVTPIRRKRSRRGLRQRVVDFTNRLHSPENLIKKLMILRYVPHFTNSKLITFFPSGREPIDYQCKYEADDEQSSDEEKLSRAVQRMKKLALLRRPSNAHACINYLQRRGLISEFRMACETPSARDYFLKKIEPSWRAEVRSCMYHRIDVSMDKLVKQSGQDLLVGGATGTLFGALCMYFVMYYLKKVSDYRDAGLRALSDIRSNARGITESAARVADETGEFAKKTGLYLLRFILCVVQVHSSFTSHNVSDKLTAILQLTVLAGEMYYTSWLEPLIDELKKMASYVTIQAASVARTPLLKALLEILSKVVGCSLFPKVPDAARFVVTSSLRYFSTAIEGADLYGSLMKAFATIIDNVKKFSISGDLIDLFGRDIESSLLAEMDVMQDEILNPSRSKLVSTSCPRIMRFRARIEEIRKMHLGDKNLQNPVFTSKVALVRDLILSFIRNSKARRKEPLGIIFAGDPGTGKTTFTETIADIVRAKHEIPSHMDVCWTYQPSKHQTIPSVVLVVEVNDAFQTKDEIEPMLPLLQSLVDKTIVKAEGASLVEKELSSVEPDFVVVSTNEEKFFFSTVSGNIDKLMRRYYLVRTFWTEKAKRKAIEGNYEVSKTWEMPGNAGQEGLVEYWFGEFSVEKQTIFFDQLHMKRGIKFDSIDGLARHIYKLYVTRIDHAQAMQPRDMCSHGVTTKASCARSPCDKPLTTAINTQFDKTFPPRENVEVTLETQSGLNKVNLTPDEMRDLGTEAYSHLIRSNSLPNISETPKDAWGFDFPSLTEPSKGFGSLYYYMDKGTSDTGSHVRSSTIIGFEPQPTHGFDSSVSEVCYNNIACIGDDLGVSRTSKTYRLPDNNFCDFGVPTKLEVGAYFSAIRSCDNRIVLINESTNVAVMLKMGSVVESYVYQHCVRGDNEGSTEEYGPYIAYKNNMFRVDARLFEVKVEMCEMWSFEMMSPVLVLACVGFLQGYMTVNLCLKLYRYVFGTNQASLGGSIDGIPNQHNDAEVIVRRNVPWLGSVSSEKTLVSCTGRLRCNGANLHFAVYCPGIVCFPKHLLESAKNNTELLFDYDSGFRHSDIYSTEKVWKCQGDLCFYFVDCVPGSYVGIENCLPDVAVTPDELTFRNKSRLVAKNHCSGQNISVCGVETVVGDCGELYFSGNVIVGMHIGIIARHDLQVLVRITKSLGDAAKKEFQRRGLFVVPQCKEIPATLTKLIKTTDQSMKRSDMYFLDESATHQQAVLSGMVPIGCKPGRDTNKPTCRRSTHYDAFSDLDPMCSGPNMGHAKLIDGAYISAVTKRYHTVKERGVYPYELAEVVVKWYTDQFGVHQNGLSKELHPITLYTALVGHPLNDLIGAKALDKAVGFDLKMKGVTKSSAFRFDVAMSKWIINPDVLFEVSDWISCINNGDYKPMIVEASVKDEVLLKSQTDKGKARLFYTPPMAYNIVLKMYFAPLVAHLYSRPEISGMFCAINPTSSDWDKLVKCLHNKGTTIFEGDQGSFDNRHSWIFIFIRKFVQRLASRLGYTDEEVEFTCRLIDRMRKYIVMIDGGLYVSNDKMYSGVWITLFFNCIATIILTRMANAMSVGEFAPDEIFVATVGDDLLMSVSDRHASRLNPSDFKGAMAEMGYEFTPSSKDEAVLRYRSIEEATFLKRGFHYQDGRWLARLAKTSLYKTLCYSLSTKDPVGRDRSAYMSVLHEAVLWGRDFYDDIYTRGVALNYAPPIYLDLYTKFLSGSFKTWDLEKLVVQPSPNYHVSYDANLTKDLVDCKPIGESISNEGLEMVLQSGLHSPTERTLDMASEVGLETASNSNITTLSVIDHTVDVSLPGSNPVYDSKVEAPLAGFWERNRRIAYYNVSASTTLNVSLNVSSAIYAIPVVAEILDQYYGYSADYKITLVYTGCTSSFGMVRCSAVAPCVTDDYNAAVYPMQPGVAFQDFTITSSRPHIDLNMSEACSCTMELPYPFPTSWVIPSSPSWTLTFTELLPLANVNGLTPNDIGLEVWVSMHNVKLYNLYPQSGMEGRDYWANSMSRAKSLAKRAVKGQVTPIMGALKMTSTALEMAGWSSPPVEPSALVISRKNINTASTVANDAAYHIAQDELTQTSVAMSQFPLGKDDDMDLVALRRKWGQIRNNWTVGSGSAVECHPGLLTGAGSDYYATPLAFFSAPFEYWTGDLEYRVEVFTSPLVRWRFAIVVTSPYIPLNPTSLPINGDYITHEVEVSGSTVYEFTVKYANYRPFTDMALSDISAHTCPNIEYLSLMQPTGPSATVPQPYINLYVRAGKNYECALPYLGNMRGFTVQSGKENVLETRESSGPSAVTAIFGTKPITNLKELMALKVPALQIGLLNTAAAGTQGNFSIPADGLPVYLRTAAIGSTPVKVTLDCQNPTFRNWLGRCFIGYNGGSSMSIAGTGSSNLETGGALSVGWNSPGYGTAYSTNSFPTSAIYPGVLIDKGIMDVSFPSRNNGRFKTTRGNVSDLRQVCLNYKTNNVLNPAATDFTVYYGGSDDLVVGGFLGIPKMSIY